jgi:DHA1 family tetracycline resistance protein-like MFS transporter
MFAYAIMQFIFSPVLGNLMINGPTHPSHFIVWIWCDYLFTAFAPTILWLFARLIAGITGASFTTAIAYYDINTPIKERILG